MKWARHSAQSLDERDVLLTLASRDAERFGSATIAHTAMTFPAAPHVAARPDETRQLSSIRKCADIQSVVFSRLLFGAGQRFTLAQIDRELKAWRFCGATR
jgi:hypothetical protein